LHWIWSPATEDTVGRVQQDPPHGFIQNCLLGYHTSTYNYTIKHKSGKCLGNADALSRLPSPVTTPQDCVIPAYAVCTIDHLSSTSTSATNIKEWTAKDCSLSCVHCFLLLGWPTQQLSKEFQPYISRMNELSILDGCILWASRVVIPPAGWQLLLDGLHDTHLGVSNMKALAQSYIWWPGMDSGIEKSCPVCQESRPSPATAPLHSWEWPSQPWSRLHLDFAGPFLGHFFNLGWCTFEMAGCPHHAVHYCCQDRWEVTNHVC